MFYKLKARALKSPLFLKAASRLRRLRGGPHRDLGWGEVPDRLKADLIERLVPGRSFADIGCMWRVNGWFAFHAERSGARDVAGVDVSPASPEFLAQLERTGSRVRFIRGDLHDPRVAEALGEREVVFCSGVLYHTPNPVDTLMRLRAICSGTLILNTSIVPEMPGIANFAVFYPYLDAAQRRTWDPGEGAVGLSTPYDPAQGYANWIWGFSRSCLESMLACAGFRVLERYGEGWLACLVCAAVEPGFRPVAGDWVPAPAIKPFES